MVAQAQTQAASAAFPGQVEFKQSNAEELPFLEDGSIDLITSGPQINYLSIATYFV